jgi:hypothetical protein
MATREDFCSYEALESHCTALSALSGVTTGDLVEAITNASELMWALTGRQFGAYTETVRPDLRGESASWFDLRRFPVTGISEVKIDGATVPSSAYWVRDGRHLVRTDETAWPQTQKLYLDDTEDETFSVTLTWGAGPPAAVAAATRRLACELLSLKFGGHSGLPDRVRSTVRQGISMEHVSAEDLLQNGRTGIYEIDFALETFNRDDNAALPAVMSPDIGWNDHDGTTTVGTAPGVVSGVSEDFVLTAISEATSGLSAGGVPRWTIGVLIPDGTIETMIGLVTWAAIAESGYVYDTEGLKYLDTALETITLVTSHAPGDLASITRVLDLTTFAPVTGGYQFFNAANELSADGPWLGLSTEQRAAVGTQLDDRADALGLLVQWNESTDARMRANTTATDLGNHDGVWEITNAGTGTGTLPPTPDGIDVQMFGLFRTPYRDDEVPTSAQYWPFQQFREWVSQTRSAATGGDTWEFALVQPDDSWGEEISTPGRAVHFGESTVISGAGEGLGLYLPDPFGPLIGVPVYLRATIDCATETMTLWRGVPYDFGVPGTEVANGITWVPVGSRTDPQYASIRDDGALSETVKLGVQNRIDYGWIKAYEYGNPTAILDIGPAQLNAAVGDTSFIDAVGNTISTTSGTIEAPSTSTAAVMADLALATTATNGTATTFEIVIPYPGVAASGVVPAGWQSVYSVPDVATFEGLLASQGLTTVTCLVPSEPGVYQFASDAVDTAWTNITPADGVLIDAGVAAGHTKAWIDGGTLNVLDANAVPYSGSGLLGVTNINTVDQALDNIEGALDTEHWCVAWYESNVTVASYLATPTVLGSQPAPTGGTVVLGGDVLLIGQSTTTQNGIYQINASTGAWTKIAYPDILIGNSFMVMVNADGSADDGTHFEWVDDDVTVTKRRSPAYLGSSDGYADGRGGRWIKYSPNGGGSAYSPAVTGDWTDPDPTTYDEALDTLAALFNLNIPDHGDRLNDLENYVPAVDGDWPDPNPSTIDSGLDKLAARTTDLEEITAGSFATSAQGVLAGTALQPTIVDADSDLIVGTAADTVGRLAVPASRIVGRKSTGSIEALTPAEIREIIRDTAEERIIFQSTRSTDGEFTTDLAALDLSTYKYIRWEFVGRSTNAAANDSLRMTFTKTGGPSGSLYGMGTAAFTTLFVLTSDLAGSLTNTDRTSRVVGDMTFMAGANSVGEVRTVNQYSDIAVGRALLSNTLYYSGTTSTGVVTGVDIYCNTGTPAAGARLTIWGRT